ncbi:MAG TPA: hypothetical protein VMW19_05515 [Myxococcota bacterium]|nr:hypothetical protein [Myxococcota bacterium]
MASLPRIAAADVHRVRRFDAVVLGGALPGIVAAIRLAQRGARVLVVEEEAAARAHPGWREPFLLWDSEPAGVLGACLRALAVPLIDQRRLVADDLALQLATKDARLDWGRAQLAAAELTSWGLAKPDDARGLLAELSAAAEAVREALLANTSPRRGAGAPTRGATAPSHPVPSARWSDALLETHPSLRGLLRDLARALTDQAGLPHEPATLRLLGAPLGGGAIVAGNGGLRELLWRRLAALFGERRAIPGPLRLVAASHLPAVEAIGVQEIWAGRVLLLNAPREALAEVHEGPAPALLRGPAAAHRRVGLHLRAPAGLLPEAMAPRLVVQGDGPPIRVARHPGPHAGGHDDFLLSTIASHAEDAESVRARLERTLHELAPFCAPHLERRPAPAARWDRDDLVHEASGEARDVGPGARLSTRPPVVSLEPGDAAAFGFEGSLLLGWRTGDEWRSELR